VKNVLKRNREREPWSDDKIRDSIEAAAREAGYATATAESVVEEVIPSVGEMKKSRDLVKTSEIRETILRQLDERHPGVSAAWRDFDKVKPAK
jgi:transcriptional regulator NrdR family protein